MTPANNPESNNPESNNPECIFGVFISHEMAQDYITNEPPITDKKCVFTRRSAFKFDSGDRVLLLNRDGVPYELSTDYTSEPVRRERELRASAKAKLTEEEIRVLRL